MEALVLLLGMLLAPLLVLLLLPAAILALASLFLLALVVPLFGRLAYEFGRTPAGRHVRRGLLALLALVAVGAATADLLFFEATLRLLLRRVEAKSGIALRFDSAAGSFFTGKVELRKVRITRQDDPHSRFDLELDRATIALPPWRLLRGTVRIDRLSIEALRGRYERIADPPALKARRAFRIERLELDRARVEVVDRRKQPAVELLLEVEQARCAPFDSEWAVLCVLFRTSARGALDGLPFELAVRKTAGGRETTWRARGLPLAKLAPYAGAPLTWLSAGKADVEVSDRWSLAKESEFIDLEYKLLLRDLQAKLPPGGSRMERLVARPMVAYLNRHSRELPLEFRVRLDRKTFHAASSPQAAGLWSAFGRGVRDAVVEKVKRRGK